MFDDRESIIIIKLNVFDEVVGDIFERFFWPWEEPIECGVANKTREVTTSDPKSNTGRRHTENNVQIFTASVDEELLSEHFAFWELLLTHFSVKWANRLFAVVGRHSYNQ